MSLFNKGYRAVREEKQRQDENREKMGKRLWRFFLNKDGDEAEVHFLTEEPINFYEHTVKTVRGGKERYDNVICTQEDCPLCANGDRPSFKGAYLLYDKRPYEYTDKNNKKKKAEGQLRLYVQGARVLSQLDRLSQRYGLTDRDYTITRTGSGTSTTYMFDRGDATGKLSKAEIKNILPEKLREDYNGTMDSLYKIVENQLEMCLKDGYDEPDDDDDDEYDEDGSNDTTKNLVGVDDEDYDDDEYDEDEDDEDEAPRRKSSKMKSSKKPSLGKKSSKSEHSVKKLFRNR